MAHIGREKKLADKKAMIMRGTASVPAPISEDRGKSATVASKSGKAAASASKAPKKASG